MEEEEWVVIRSKLREVWLEHPEWSHQEMANELGCSKSWVKNWIKRIRSASLESQEILRGKPRAPKHPPPPMDPRIVEKTLEIRDHPPQQLGRTPGPLTMGRSVGVQNALEGRRNEWEYQHGICGACQSHDPTGCGSD